MKKVLECSRAIAHIVKLCKPDVCAMYPISPATHIPEEIAKLVASSRMKSKLIRVESEFSAMSACIGATATGVRSFTASSSQGIALMHELLFAAVGMRLPIVMVVTNRTLSAPINIWCDHQDTISERDSGWLQFYCRTAQEAIDTLLQAYKIAEDARVLLPVMVCVDGWVLSHVIEPVDIPAQKDVDKFLPAYTPKHAFLNPNKPLTQGSFFYPHCTAPLKKQLDEDLQNSIKVIKQINNQFKDLFGRSYGDGLIEEYKSNRDFAIIALGSICGTIKEVVDEREDVGLIRIRCYRPFPKQQLITALKNKKMVLVLDRNHALGLGSGAVYSEIRDLICSMPKRPRVNNVIAGLGGMDITKKMIHSWVDELRAKDSVVKFVVEVKHE